MFDELFGPLSGQYCAYYYYLAVICYIIAIISALGALIAGVQAKSLTRTLELLWMTVPAFLAYFVNRLLYSMCVKSLL